MATASVDAARCPRASTRVVARLVARRLVVVAATASIDCMSGDATSLRRCIRAVVAAMRYSQVVKRESPRKLARCR